MMKGTILVVDDEEQLRKLLSRILALEGYSLLEASGLQQALQVMKTKDVDLVLCDVKLQDGNGVDFVPILKRSYPTTEIILLTAYGNIADGVTAIKHGAFDYLTKGNDNDRIIPLVAQGITKAQAQKAKAVLITPKNKTLMPWESRDGNMQQLIALSKKIATSQSTVLLTGETGTGKEVAAQWIHTWSPRHNEAFVAINCSAFPKDLLESELFGHKAGAFTGATKDKKGLAEMADGGTLFLDEIGEIPIDLQAKMLRFLEAGEFFKVGDTKLTRVHVRLVAATNRNLETAINDGQFRKDLYYRLNTFTISLPPLRERIVDIPTLAEQFITYFALQESKPPLQLSAAALEALKKYTWPGNIRELRNHLERAVILAEGTIIEPADLPPPLQHLSQQLPAYSLAEVEKEHIRKILVKTGHNKTKAANLLGIGLATLYRKLEEYGIPK